MAFLLFLLPLFHSVHSLPLPLHYSFKFHFHTITDIFPYLHPHLDSLPPHIHSLFTSLLTNNTITNITALQHLAHANIPLALHLLGELYLYGLSPVRQNVSKAAQLFKRSSLPESFSHLSFLYRHGLGVSADPLKSAVYADLACQNGSASSCLFQGYSSLENRLLPKSISFVQNLFLPICNRLATMADMNLLPPVRTTRISRDLTIPEAQPDDPRATEMMEYRAKMGDRGAELKVAEVYYIGELGNDIDFDRARQLYERHLEDPNALVHLGKMYHLGEGVPVNLEKAEHYYKMAAEMDNPAGLNNLGVLKKTLGDIKSSELLIEQAAAAGHETAIYNRAMILISQNNYKDALVSFRYLADRNVVLAENMVARMLLLSKVAYNPQEAIDWFRKILVRGPWVKLSKTAEEYWKAGNFNGAVLLWMELADCGFSDAAFNAGFGLLNVETFMTNGQQHKLSRRMFKKLKFLTGEDVSQYLMRGYDDPEKAKRVLIEMAGSSTSFYRLAEAHLDGRIDFRLKPILGNLSLAIAGNGEFMVPAVLLGPKVVWGMVKQGWKCAKNDCRMDEIQDLVDVLIEFCKVNVNGLGCIIALVMLIVVVRKRVALCFVNDEKFVENSVLNSAQRTEEFSE